MWEQEQAELSRENWQAAKYRSWSEVEDFHSHLIQATNHYVQDCLKANKPMGVDDFISWYEVQKDLAKEYQRKSLEDIDASIRKSIPNWPL